MPSLDDPDRGRPHWTTWLGGGRPHWTTWLGGAAAHPAAFGIVVVYALAWLVFDRERFGFDAVATLIVWVMTLFIARSNRRDTLASMPSSTSCFAPTPTPVPS